MFKWCKEYAPGEEWAASKQGGANVARVKIRSDHPPPKESYHNTCALCFCYHMKGISWLRDGRRRTCTVSVAILRVGKSVGREEVVRHEGLSGYFFNCGNLLSISCRQVSRILSLRVSSHCRCWRCCSASRSILLSSINSSQESK